MTIQVLNRFTVFHSFPSFLRYTYGKPVIGTARVLLSIAGPLTIPFARYNMLVSKYEESLFWVVTDYSSVKLFSGKIMLLFNFQSINSKSGILNSFERTLHANLNYHTN